MGPRATGVGVAIAPDRVTARGAGRPASGLAWERALPPLDAPGAEWREALRDAFRSLRAAAPDARSLHVTLLPPIAEVRVSQLPPVGAERLRPVIARDASKYFPVGNEPQVVQVRERGARTNGAFTRHLLSAAPERVVEDILAAATAAGWTVASLAPAHDAWAAAALGDARSNGANANGACKLALVRSADRVDSFEIADHAVTHVRRYRSADAADDPAGTRVLASNAGEAAALAARFAALPDDASLWPERVYAARARHAWTLAGRFALAAFAMVVITLALEWIGSGGALARVSAARAAVRPRVQTALRLRDSLELFDQRRAMLERFGAARPRWSATLVEVGRALPDDASLLLLRTNGDTLVLTGDAAHAATVFTAFAQSKAFRGVRAEAPIQQQVEGGEVVAERFTLAAQRRP